MPHIRGACYIDTWPLAASLYGRPSLFDEVSLRQAAPGSPHRHTRSIILRAPAVAPALLEAQPHLDLAAIAALWFADVPYANTATLDGWPEATAILAELSRLLWTTPEALGKAMIVELAPGKAVDWHVDEGAYALAYLRYHLPLVTNPQAYLLSGGDQAHVPVGCLTELDTDVLHSAVNMGAHPRIHLIVDVRRKG